VGSKPASISGEMCSQSAASQPTSKTRGLDFNATRLLILQAGASTLHRATKKGRPVI
jgi:hypothetical protein